ncbi:hypothetical protein TNCV_4546711 [Trichonephila clavipes]|nr:hypothetical protein TNCV_4546711 [Trichonephila clavipes]
MYAHKSMVCTPLKQNTMQREESGLLNIKIGCKEIGINLKKSYVRPGSLIVWTGICIARRPDLQSILNGKRTTQRYADLGSHVMPYAAAIVQSSVFGIHSDNALLQDQGLLFAWRSDFTKSEAVFPNVSQKTMDEYKTGTGQT